MTLLKNMTKTMEKQEQTETSKGDEENHSTTIEKTKTNKNNNA